VKRNSEGSSYLLEDLQTGLAPSALKHRDQTRIYRNLSGEVSLRNVGERPPDSNSLGIVHSDPIFLEVSFPRNLSTRPPRKT
jgi:hypothetical protein